MYVPREQWFSSGSHIQNMTAANNGHQWSFALLAESPGRIRPLQGLGAQAPARGERSMRLEKATARAPRACCLCSAEVLDPPLSLQEPEVSCHKLEDP